MASSSDSTKIPGLQPPPGQTSNFHDPWSLHSVIFGVLIFGIVSTTLTTAARCYSRKFIANAISWDDYIMLVAWAAYVPYVAIVMWATRYGAGIHQWNVPVTHLKGYAYWGFVDEIFYPLIIAIVKLSICLQMLRIFATYRDRTFWLIWIFIALQMAWFFCCFWVSLFQCTPVQKVYDSQRHGSCLSGYQSYIIAVGIFNMVSDILMLLFPLFCISRLQLHLQKKLGVAAVFLVGSGAVAADILRVIFSFRNQHNKDQTFSLTQVALCTVGELTAGILAGNAVTLPQFIILVNTKFSSIRSSIVSQTRLWKGEQSGKLERSSSSSNEDTSGTYGR